MNFYDKPVNQEFQLEGVMHISPEEAYTLVCENKVFFIDVREESEYSHEYLDFDNVFFHPLSVIMDRLAYIPKEVPLIIVCNEGIRSVKIANLLMRQGFEQVANLDGGLDAWAQKGLPIVHNPASASTSGCGCGCDDDEDEDDHCGSSGCGCSGGCC